ncbi:transposase [Streptomyces lavendulae]|uniref:transposase n=1 Tax=Streptomyces lavendulae TaxID=1914 RepID=UPI003409C047
MVDHVFVIRRHELTDVEWELLAPLIPSAGRGRPRAEDRRVINGMVYKIRTGVGPCPRRVDTFSCRYAASARVADCRS